MKRGQLVQVRLCSWWGCRHSGEWSGSLGGQSASQRLRLFGAGVEFAVGFGDVLRGVASICADGDGVGAKGFGDVVDVIEEGTDVAAAAEECGYIGDAHGAPGVEYCRG